MPLGQLANEIVRQSQAMTHTPVLVTPSYLSLRTPFFVQLTEAIWQRSGQRVRIDWYRDPGSHLLGLMASVVARQRARSINRCLQHATGSNPTQKGAAFGSIEITASIARPDAGSQLLVVGLCDDRVELPSWTAAVRLTGWPVSATSAPDLAASRAA